MLSDVERMGILCHDIADSLEDKIAKKYKYSKDAMKDLEKSLKVIEEMYSGAIDVMTTGNPDSAKKSKRGEKRCWILISKCVRVIWKESARENVQLI